MKLFNTLFSTGNIHATIAAFAMIMATIMIMLGMAIAIKHEFFNQDTPCAAPASTTSTSAGRRSARDYGSR